jgi:hypothetical protein
MGPSRQKSLQLSSKLPKFYQKHQRIWHYGARTAPPEAAQMNPVGGGAAINRNQGRTSEGDGREEGGKPRSSMASLLLIVPCRAEPSPAAAAARRCLGQASVFFSFLL